MPPDYLNLLQELAEEPLGDDQLSRLQSMAENTEDALTGVLSFRAFCARLRKSRVSPCALVAVGIDHLQEINLLSTWVSGDFVLCRAGRLIDARLRPDEFAGRLAGSSFGVLIQAGSPVEVKRWLGALSQDLGAVEIPNVDLLPDGKVTLSAGCMVAPDMAGDRPEALLHDLRRRLKFARKQGGDAVTMLDPGATLSDRGRLAEFSAVCRVPPRQTSAAALVGVTPHGCSLGMQDPVLARTGVELEIEDAAGDRVLACSGSVVWRQVGGEANDGHAFVVGIRFGQLDADQQLSIQSIISGSSHAAINHA